MILGVHFIDNAHFDSPPRARGIWVSKDLPSTLPNGESGYIGITITISSNGKPNASEGVDAVQFILCHSSGNMYYRWSYFYTYWYGWVKLN